MRSIVRKTAIAMIGLGVAGLLPGLPLHQASASELDSLSAQAQKTLSTPAVQQAVSAAIPQEFRPLIPDLVPELVEAPTPAVTSPAPQPSSAQAPMAQPTNPGPQDRNYHWTNDLLSRVLAGKPLDPLVLHRVNGSYFDAPDIPPESHAAEQQGKSLYGPGTPIYVGNSNLCTLTAAGYDAQGRMIGITAGHCGNQGDSVSSADSWRVGPTGTVVASNPGADYSLIQFHDNAEVTRSYNGLTVNTVGGAPRPGEQVCKTGVATGTTCGITLNTDSDVLLTQVCAMQGDSGAPVWQGDRLVGWVSGGVYPDYNLACHTPLQGMLFMPTVVHRANSGLADINGRGAAGSGFRLAN
ncbi:serine protease [Corynebacterium sp. 3HC-13]|uniref:S1 family peptidase n=1 Tax=Corynebacterium poyangense TaxID=2684405 RepID=UPI001CC9608F|nr:S1 family peptidase [Corynebacterium poyangense]MBZ8176928.1 serine protease [Corynebacterium poyangense]